MKTATALKPSDYKCIAAWGKQMGSYAYYIKMQQEKCAAMQAPKGTIYFKGEDGDKPVTIEQVKNMAVVMDFGRQGLIDIVQENGKTTIVKVN